MKYRRNILTILVISLLAVAANAQKGQFKWSEPMCDFVGTFDTGKYTQKQIEDTRKLIEFGIGLPLQTSQTVFDPKDIPTLDVDKLDEEYRITRIALNELTPVDNEYFRELRSNHTKTLDRAYGLMRATLVAYREPGALKEAEGVEACYSKWGEPVIAGGSDLLGAWKMLLEEQKKINASPEGLQARFNTRYNSAQRDEWALVEVLTFGWWNCINRTIPYVDNDGTAETEFRKLFIKVTEECEEP